jgi:hypothetical protein
MLAERYTLINLYLFIGVALGIRIGNSLPELEQLGQRLVGPARFAGLH